MQLLETLQQRIILLKALAEAETRIEHDTIPLHSHAEGNLGPVSQFPLHQNHNVRRRWQALPLLRTSPRVHQHSATFQFHQRLRHLWIPAKSADVIHNLGACLHRRTRNFGFVSVYRNHSIRLFLFKRRDDWNHSVQFFLFADCRLRRSGGGARFFRTRCGRRDYLGPRPGRLASDVNDIGPFLQHFERVFERALAIKMQPAVRKRIWSNIQHAHDERAFPQSQFTGTDVPVENRPHRADSKPIFRKRLVRF